MPESAIPGLPNATVPLGATDVFTVNQSGTTKKVTREGLVAHSTPMKGEYAATIPPTPSNNLTLFTKTSARPRMSWIGPSGIDVSAQSYLATNKIGFWSAQGSSTTAYNSTTPGLFLFCFGHTTTGTVTARSPAVANMFTSSRRMGFRTTATAGTTAGTRHGLLQFSRRWGFEYIVRFGISEYNTAMRAFVGFSRNISTPASPTIAVPNHIGIGFNAGDSTWSIMCGDNATALTRIPLSSSFPATTANEDLYEFKVFTPPNSLDTSPVYWAVTRLNTGDYVEGVLTPGVDKLPSLTTTMGPEVYISNTTGAVTCAIDVISQYIETDN